MSRYRLEGDSGLIHRIRGVLSNRMNPNHNKNIELYKEKYMGFGPPLASEYIEEEGFPLHRETLRRLLLSKSLLIRQRKHKPYRQRRQRKEQFGELVQIDGSIHDWFEDGTHKCLLNMVDDATGKTLSKLAEGETCRVVFECLMAWIQKYGTPLAR